MGQVKEKKSLEKKKTKKESSIRPKSSIEEIFYNNPIKLYHIRELSRLTGVPKSTVALKVKALIKDGIVREEKDVFKVASGRKANFLRPMGNFSM